MKLGRLYRTFGFFAFGVILCTGVLNDYKDVEVDAMPLVASEKLSSWEQIDFNEYIERDRKIEEVDTPIMLDKLYDVPLSAELQYYLKDKCNEMGVDFVEALAVMEVESYYNSDLIHTNNNGTKDYGLMQINSIHHDWLRYDLGVKDFLNPYQNINCGVYLLSRRQDVGLHERLMGYNMGSPQTKKLRSQGTYSTKYSRKVESIMRRLNSERNS